MKTHFIHFETIDSTNTWVKQHVDQLVRDCLNVISADAQTAGRGRFQRTWESPRHDNLYVSFCFLVNPKTPLQNLAQILSLSAAAVLEKHHFAPKIKWPNDLLLSNKKVGGILCETTSHWMIAGIGLNINMKPEMLPKISQPATSLFMETGQQFDVKEILHEITQQFSNDLSRYLKEGFQPFFSAYRRYLKHLSGESMRIKTPQGICEGTFLAIQPDGSLNLRLPSGEMRNFLSGDVIY